jgi:GTP-binding protein Era
VKALRSEELASTGNLDNLRVFSPLADLSPQEFIDFLEQFASLLPASLRFRLRSAVRSLPPHGDNLERVLELVRKSWEGLQSDDWIQIAVVGPARTGKSTLVRELLRGAGTETRRIFRIVDTQGLEEFLGYRRTERLPEGVSKADVILLVLDARYRFTEDTVRMVNRFASLGKTFIVVLNKIDSVESPRRTVRRAKLTFGVDVLSSSAFRPKSLDRLLKSIVAAHSKALYPLAQTLPRFRASVCESVVAQSAVGAGLVGAVPIPVSDAFAISGIQVAMLLKIARVYGFKINRGRARELLPLLVSGILMREGAHRLRERYPEHRRLIAVTVGGGWTYLVGRAAVRYFDQLREFADRVEE